MSVDARWASAPGPNGVFVEPDRLDAQGGTHAMHNDQAILMRRSCFRGLSPAILTLLLLAPVLGDLPTASAQNPAPASANAGDDAEALAFASGLFRSRRYDLAADEYERLLQTRPARDIEAEARFGLANARHFLQEYGKAREQFEAFLKLVPATHPNAATAQFRVGELAYVLGDLPAARSHLEAFLLDHPDHRQAELALPYLGDVLFRQRDFPAAEAAYRKTLAQYPDGRLSDRARLYLARTLAAREQKKDAETLLLQLLDRPKGANRDEAWYQLGLIRAEDGRHAEAAEAFENLERDVPQSRLVSRARLARAEAYSALDRFDDAETLLAPLAADPSPDLAARAAYARGANELRRDRPEAALELFNRAIDAAPDSGSRPALLYRAAETLARLDRRAEARDRYLEMAQSYPNDSWADDAMLQAASLSLGLQEPDRALELARDFQQSFPESPLRPGAQVVEARALLDSGQADAAARLLEQTVEPLPADSPTGTAARYYLGLAYRALGKTDQAAQMLQNLSGKNSAFTAEALYLVGQDHFDAGRFDEAVATLERYLEDRPNGAAADHALARLAMAHAERNQLDAAAEALKTLESRFPSSELVPLARIRLGEKALAARDWDRVDEFLTPVARLADNPLAPRALQGLGWAALEQENWAEAQTQFATLLEIAPNDPAAPEAALLLARALDRQGKTDDALAALDRIPQTDPASPRFADALLARARLLVAADRPADALAPYADYVGNHLAANDQEPAVEVLNEYAWALLDAGKTADSDAIFQRIVQEYPDSGRAAEARLNLAQSAFEQGRFDEVVALLEPLAGPDAPAEADPKLVQSALYRLGRAQIEQKEWTAARQSLDRLLQAAPDGDFSRESRFWIAEIAYQTGQFDEALAAFNALLETPGPDASTEPWLLTASLRKVQTLVSLKRWDDALAAADALQAATPDFPQRSELQYARGQALMALTRFDEARNALEAAIDARRGSEIAAMAQFLRGETFFHQENHREALREYLKVATLYNAPRWQALALLEAGKVYEQLGRWDDAAAAYEELRANFPDDPSATEAGQRISAARARGSSNARRQE